MVALSTDSHKKISGITRRRAPKLSLYSNPQRRDAHTNDLATTVRRRQHAGFNTEIFDGQCINDKETLLQQQCLPQWRGPPNTRTAPQEQLVAVLMSASNTVLI